MCDRITTLPSPGEELFMYLKEPVEVGEQFEVPMGELGTLTVRAVKVRPSVLLGKFAVTVEVLW
jgi:hypothetical protein